MTNTNSVQNLINEIKSTRGVTVSVFGQPQEMPATVEKGYVDIIDILEGFAGYEVETVLPAQYRVDYDEQNNVYDIMDTNDDVIEGGFNDEESAEDRMYELQEYNTTTVSIDDYMAYMEEMGYLEEKEGSNSYNWLGKVSNHFNYRIYQHEDGSAYVEFAAHLYGDVRANYTERVLLKFKEDYFFYEGIAEVSGYEEYKGYGIRFSALGEGYEINHIESDEDMETKYAWDDVIEYIDGLVEEEMSEGV